MKRFLAWLAQAFAAPAKPTAYIPPSAQDQAASPSWSTTLAGWR